MIENANITSLAQSTTVTGTDELSEAFEQESLRYSRRLDEEEEARLK